MRTCLNCGGIIPNFVLFEGKKKRLFPTRIYCLKCSPYLQHNNCKLHVTGLPGEEKPKTCPRCKQEKTPDEFYNRRGIKGRSVYCRKCTTVQTMERTRKFKQKCLDYKGGKCQICGYDKYIGSLELHHRDPSKKEFALGTVKCHSYDDDRIIKELDKCDLLCSNCHREEHARMNGLI